MKNADAPAPHRSALDDGRSLRDAEGGSELCGDEVFERYEVARKATDDAGFAP